MKKIFAIVFFLFACLMHTVGFGYATFSLHDDDFGSVIALTNPQGIVLYSASYGPHGEDWGSTGYNPTPFGWLGGYGVMALNDGTPLKLYLTRHRLYSATLNRFLSADPLGLQGGLNLYQYGEGNPMAYIDPLGLCGIETAERGFWDNFALGYIMGDLAHDTGLGGFLGEVVAGVTPYWGVASDFRDFGVNANDFRDTPGWGSGLGVVGSVLGFVPVAGDFAKQAIKVGREAVQQTGQVVLAKNARILTESSDVFKHLEKYNGIDPRLASDRLHEIKKASGRGGADNVIFDMTGNVYDPITKEWLGSLTQGGAQAVK